MQSLRKSLVELTAADLMTRDVVQVRDDMSIRDAGLLLAEKGVSGAPVVDRSGRCVGAIALTDFARLALKHGADAVLATPRPHTCQFQQHQVGADGLERVVCLLPGGVCPFQREETAADGRHEMVCSQPHCVPVDWQVVATEQLPAEQVRAHMTPNRPNVVPDTSICALARLMVDGHTRRLFVVDGERRPVGVVSSTDILRAVADADSLRPAVPPGEADPEC